MYFTSPLTSISVFLSLLPSGVTQTLIFPIMVIGYYALFKPLCCNYPLLGTDKRNHCEFSDFQIFSYLSPLCSINPISYDNKNNFPYQYSTPGEHCFLCFPVSCKTLLYLLLDACVCVSVEAQLHARSWILNNNPATENIVLNQQPRGSAARFISLTLARNNT